MFYIALHSFTFVLIFLRKYLRNKNSLFIVTMLVLFYAMILSGIRLNVGHDYDGYSNIYNTLDSLFSYENFNDLVNSFTKIHGEFGFLFIIAFFKEIGISFESFIFIFSLFSFSILSFTFVKLINEFNLNVFISLFLYFSFFYFVSHFSQIRFGLVISIFLLLIYFMYRNNIILYFIALLFGAFMHKIILIVLPLYFFRNFSVNSYFKSVIILIIGALIHKIDIINTIIEITLGSNSWITTQVLYYITEDKYLNAPIPLISILYFTLVYFLSLYIHRSIKSIDERRDKLISLLLFLYLLSIFIIIAFFDVGIIGSRVGMMLSVSLILIVPFILDKINSIAFKIIYLGIVSLYAFIKFYKSIYFEENNLLPYKTIFNLI